MAEPRAGLIEVLLPVLDALCADLITMHASTAIELDSWPAAKAFVEAWAGGTTAGITVEIRPNSREPEG